MGQSQGRGHGALRWTMVNFLGLVSSRWPLTCVAKILIAKAWNSSTFSKTNESLMKLFWLGCKFVYIAFTADRQSQQWHKSIRPFTNSTTHDLIRPRPLVKSSITQSWFDLSQFKQIPIQSIRQLASDNSTPITEVSFQWNDTFSAVWKQNETTFYNAN